MKIMSFTPIKYETDYGFKNVNRSLQATPYDVVSFKARPKNTNKVANDVFKDFMNNIGEDLGTKVRNIMSNPKSKNIFTATLVSLAVSVTELIMQKEDIEQNTIPTETKQEQSEKTEENIAQETKTQTKRKRIASQMGEDVLIAKLQEMANKGYTLAQMSAELGGLGISSISKYMKKYNITKQKIQDIEEQKPDNKKDGKADRYEVLIQKPEIKANLESLKSFSLLSKKYQEVLNTYAADKKNKENKQAKEGIEKILSVLQGFPSRFSKQYLELFETKYAESFDKLGIIANNIPQNQDIQEFLSDLKEGGYSVEDINQKLQYPALTFKEIKIIEELPQKNKAAINEIKQKNNFKFELIKDEIRHNYGFILHFAESNKNLSDKLKTISRFHEALYDNIYLHKDTGSKAQRVIDIQDELQKLVKKDKNWDSVYNTVKYLVPEEFINFDYEQNKNDSKIMNKKLEDAIKKIDIHTLEAIELENIINDDEIFDGLMSNNHAKIRFISRFVLNRDVDADDLYTTANEAINQLKEDLIEKLNSGCYVFPYEMNESNAPSFYLAKSKLGDYIKITLNNQGEIHTIYEDSKKKSRRYN